MNSWGDLSKEGFKGYSEGAPLKRTDPWDGIFQPGPGGFPVCVYCGHPPEEHGGESLMWLRPRARKRIRLGLWFCWCEQCSREKKTQQVQCYLVPSGVLERVRKAGGKILEID